MSAVIDEKTQARRRGLCWPFSRQFSLSLLSVGLLLLLWWGITALGLVAPLFLPPPQVVLQKLILIASPQGFMDATLWQHLGASLALSLIHI